jgi:lantibiotic modifying enzyme
MLLSHLALFVEYHLMLLMQFQLVQIILQVQHSPLYVDIHFIRVDSARKGDACGERFA